ncbi:effector-associated domain EAD1-containing protein [Mastigocoleus testarum]|uniref:Uncharacterized protein n=1 Tax=Mastigocoleus testarum BC008 TaxID=371196 RepID=A0A0V7ZQM1_9CYAN|nr:effector-associated domain EAD1-containing protein [Mastigocoleus testarum]KST66734.1 hypothetical protein BC008_26445 [Mastigocoleus testarum BC008]
MSNSKIFSDLELNHTIELESALQNLFINIDGVAGRRGILRNAGIDNHFIANFDFNLGINEFTTILVSKFKDYSVSRKNPSHPLVKLLSYILRQPQKYNLDDEDIKIFTEILSIGRKKIEAFQTNTTETKTDLSIPAQEKLDQKLTGQQHQKLTDALIAAFPSRQKLAMFLSFELDKELDAIAMGDNLREIVFKLIETAKSEEWLDELIKGARKSNPGNQALLLFEQEYYRDTPNDNLNIYKTNTTKTKPDLFIPPEDELEYQVEEQPWYASSFPELEETAEEECNSIKSEIDVVLITATNTELKAVANLLQPYPEKQKILLVYSGPETYYIGQFGAWKTVVTKCRMGSIGEGSVILATEQAQRLWNPRAIIMVGIAFGKDPIKQRIADVLVASQIISYEQQRAGAEKIEYRGTIPPSNTTLLNRFENIQNWDFTCPNGRKSEIKIGPILSGEKLVDDPVFKAKLFEQFPQAIGGEMEGAGLCAASGRVGTAWILVKSICDWGDGKKHKKHQPLAAAAAASLVHQVLSQKTVLNAVKKPLNN